MIVMKTDNINNTVIISKTYNIKYMIIIRTYNIDTKMSIIMGGLPISWVAPLYHLLHLSLGSSGWFSQCMSYEDSNM